MPMNPRLLRPLARGNPLYYYNNATEDGDWNTLGNWWMNSSHTIPATVLPGSGDDVIVTSQVTSNGGDEPTLANLTSDSPIVSMSLTVTGLMTMNGGYFQATLTGNAVFNNSAALERYVSGNCTFNGSSTLGFLVSGGGVGGTMTFNDYSQHTDGGIYTFGLAIFNDESSVSSTGHHGGNAVFNHSSKNDGTVDGNATFNGTSLNNSSGTVSGNATFNGDTENQGVVNGNATFNDDTGNYNGAVGGNATFSGTSFNSGTVTGTATFTGSACNSDGVGTAGTFVPNPPPSCP